MGQKINPIIFRSGINANDWKTHYFNTNTEESALYLSQNIQLRNYLLRIFELHGFVLVNCIIKRSNVHTELFLKFYISSKAVFKVKRIQSFKNFKQRRTTAKLPFKQLKRRLKLQIAKRLYPQNTPIKNDSSNLGTFKQKLIKSLHLFTGSSQISINFHNVENEKKAAKLVQNHTLKPKLQELRIYSKERFFQEALDILLINFQHKSTATLLGQFIATQFQSLKRHNNFLTFLKRALSIFQTVQKSKIQGLQVLITGRFNGVPRAKGRMIQVGTIPLQTITSNIDYSFCEAQTSYGTFGIKIWICNNSN